MSIQAGKITLITGPMFSEKSNRLIERITTAKRANKRVLAVKPEIDERDKDKISTKRYNPDNDEFVSLSFTAHIVDDDNPEDTIELIKNSDFDIFVADEIQFFSEWFIELIYDLAWHEDNFIGGWADWRRGYAREEWKGKEVVLAGLDLTAWRRPFGITPQIAAMSDNVIKRTADCFTDSCSNEARFTQLIADSEEIPDDVNEYNPVLPGGDETYEARCNDCWIHPSEL